VSLAGCVVEGTVRSLQPLVVADPRADSLSAEAVVMDVARPDARADGAAEASVDAGERDTAEEALVDVRQTEVSTPEVPLCGPEGTCPLARYCSRTLCQAPWSGCDQDERSATASTTIATAFATTQSTVAAAIRALRARRAAAERA
jgi:hypothetical protein